MKFIVAVAGGKHKPDVVMKATTLAEAQVMYDVALGGGKDDDVMLAVVIEHEHGRGNEVPKAPR